MPKKLPETWQGAAVVRGLGMNSHDMDDLVDRKAMDEFRATKPMYLVLDDRALRDADGTCEVKGFASYSDAVRYARACGNGNVDQRVLTVTKQTLVVATANDL